MKMRLFIPFVICILMTTGLAGTVWGGAPADKAFSANQFSTSSFDQLQRLDQIASSLYEAAFANNRQAGYQYVQQLQHVIANELKNASGQSEGWLVIGQDAAAIEKTLLNSQTGSGWLMEAARIRLASDALVRPEHALWLQYEKVMLDDLTRVEKAWKRQTNDGAVAARAAMRSLEEHAGRIRPALTLLYGSKYEAETGERIRYTNLLLEASANNRTNDATVDRSITALKEAVMRLFEQSGRVDSMPAIAVVPTSNPLSWTLFMGALISAILTYSGWRKYKANPFGVKPIQ